MKSLYLALLLAFLSVCKVHGQYDKALADSLGADEYGMKSYFLVMLKTGPKQIDDEGTKNILFRGHMDNILKLSKAGKLIVAGPLGENENSYRGIFIFDAQSKDEVESYLKDDPAIKAGVFSTEIYNWYGSAALPAYLPVHRKIEKQSH